ncbi:MAG: protein translocase subunit SecF [Pelatocladus maniniholoensis HA4357-MV3]|jgi:preprotein translocase subunit SecF|uniref:Protein-export membrane protein SecF n=1 Tax=Pelatocladus maniniholoensis HA4357-MV3 TaxID=1117104 RepID=A0A9E3HB04_9NOST|nr:protein translocase subunit SecF [Pelatocladus maniniholoensis HA4357-MV3]BAZ68669.1 protein-export membrane protein SecF [Fischerella sp. NIES-4106]
MKLSINKSRSLWWIISGIIILAGIISMVISYQQIGAPLRPSLDFVGGTRLQFERDCTNPDNCSKAIDINEVREVANAQGLGDSSIQIIADKDTRKDNGVLIRTKALDVEKRTSLQNALSEKIGSFDPQKTQIDTVGPTIGRELFRSGVIALIVSFVGIIVYLSFRFQLDYAIFAIIALFHDVLITVGIFSILGLVAGIEVDSLFIVALLTITGFSVNDTVVIYDRIRETLKTNPNRPIADIVDDAVNQTLARSINTTLTTLLTLSAIFLFGGATLKFFSLALIIGFTMGAYSSIFIASTFLALWRERKGQPVVSPTSESINS